MTNEEFQKTVLQELKGLKQDISGLKQDVSDLKQGQARLEKKLDAVYDQTAYLTEFRTDVLDRLDKMSDDIDFLKHEEYKNRQDIYKLKNDVKLVREDTE